MSEEKQHGYPNCDCDLVGGDEECKIQPPYETAGGTIARLQHQLAAVTQQCDHFCKMALIPDGTESRKEIARLQGELRKQDRIIIGMKRHCERRADHIKTLEDALREIEVNGDKTLIASMEHPEESRRCYSLGAHNAFANSASIAIAALKDRP